MKYPQYNPIKRTYSLTKHIHELLIRMPKGAQIQSLIFYENGMEDVKNATIEVDGLTLPIRFEQSNFVWVAGTVRIEYLDQNEKV